MIRIISLILAIVAAFICALAAFQNATTGNPLHYIAWGLVVGFAAIGAFILSTIVERPVP